MDGLSLIAVAVALAMDAFAVALAAGVVLRPLCFRPCFRLAFHFGLFQALMPVIGWLAGLTVQTFVAAWSHWIAFCLLVWVGGHMIREALAGEEATRATDPSRGLTMVALAVATSIDALAVGITLALLPGVNIVAAVLFIGCITFILSAVGLKVGNVFGLKYKNKAEMVGGAILILMGLKILLEHLGVIQF